MALVDKLPDPPIAKLGRPPRPRMKVKRLREIKKSAQDSLRFQIKKKKEAAKKYNYLKQAVNEKEDNLKAISDALKGKETTLITGDNLRSATPSILDYIADRPIIFQPNPGPQEQFLAAPEREVFFGGARGGGKSFAMLADPLRFCHKQAHRALLIRRTLPELRELIDHSRRLYSQAFPKAKYREEEKVWRFPSGARIEFGYAENMSDALRYQGQSYTWIGVDELPQYANADIWNFLRSSLRSIDPEVPVYMRATGNPGNIGSRWVREYFIDPAPWGEPFYSVIETPLGRKKISRRFIPAKLSDNPYLMQTDDYIVMLSSLPEVQKKQFLEGNWDVFENSAFPEFKREIHTVDSFKIPPSWIKFRAADWGYSSNACCLWFAIDYDNNLWVYNELYTKHLTADIFAQKVREMSTNDTNLRYSVMDASVWQKRGDIGPSIVETMQKHGVRWKPSDRSANSRKNGKMEIHRRLMLKSDGKPSLFITKNCANLIRTMPQLPLDENDPEDIDTDAEDHAYDALRYGCMSRPINPKRAADLLSSMGTQRMVAGDKIFGY